MGLGAGGEAAQAQGLGQRRRAEALAACVFSCSMQEQGRSAMDCREGPMRWGWDGSGWLAPDPGNDGADGAQGWPWRGRGAARGWDLSGWSYWRGGKVEEAGEEAAAHLLGSPARGCSGCCCCLKKERRERFREGTWEGSRERRRACGRRREPPPRPSDCRDPPRPLVPCS